MSKAAIGVVFNQKKTHLLLVRRRDVPLWVLPGGGVDQGETFEEAVIREVAEETGARVTVTRKVGQYFPLNRLAYYTEVFECSPLSEKEELLTGPESKEVAFFDLSKLPPSFFDVHRAWLGDALASKGEVISRPISEVTYFKLFLYFLRHPFHVVRFALSRLGFPLNNR